MVFFYHRCIQPLFSDVSSSLISSMSQALSRPLFTLLDSSRLHSINQRSLRLAMTVHGHNHNHGRGHEHCLKMAKRADGTPWWSDFPEPRSVAAQVEPAQVLQLLQDQESLSEDKPRDFLLVDARRTDCTGGTVYGSLNLPAHSFYSTRKTLYDLCKQAGIKKVIFYCGESASLGTCQIERTRPADNGESIS
jgi:hypothetical protein